MMRKGKTMRTCKESLKFAACVVMIFGLAIQAHAMKTDEKSTSMEKKTIADTLKGTPECSQFLEQAKNADVMKKLEEKGPYTVLVPTNAAYDALSSSVREKIKDDKEAGKTLVQYHILHGDLSPTDLKTLEECRTLCENGAECSMNFSAATKDSKNAIVQEIPCANGRIYLINEVLVPEKLKPNFMELIEENIKSAYEGARHVLENGIEKATNGKGNGVEKATDTMKNQPSPSTTTPSPQPTKATTSPY